MAYTTINKSSLHMNTKLYNGNGNAGHSITGVGFKPDLVWIKRRNSATGHHLHNVISGATKYMFANDNAAESTDAQKLSSFNSDGFTVGTNGDANNSSGTFASWNWKESTAAGFDIISYTGTGSNIDLSHNLSAIPDWIMIKARSGSDAWRVYSKAMGYDKRLVLSEAGASSTSALGLDAAPTSSVINIGTDTACTNQNNKTYICYAFKNVQGFSKFGSYTGGGSNFPFIYTGFKPAFVMIKKTNGSENWKIWDNKRPGFNELNYQINANNNEAEGNSSNNRLDLLSNGFKLRGSGDTFNSSGGNYIFMAFAAAPLVGTNNIPATAR